MNRSNLLALAVCGWLSVNCAAQQLENCRDYRVKGTLDAQLLWQDLESLAADTMQGRKSQTNGAEQARQFLVKRFGQIGLQPFSSEGQQDYLTTFVWQNTIGSVEGVNVLGFIPGRRFADQFIVVSAHYDHLGMTGRRIFNGADDNASGVAVMLTLAEQIQKKGSQYSILFLATDAEEKGLYGARAFVESPPIARDQIVFNLNLDMLSQEGRRNRLYVSHGRDFAPFEALIETAIQDAGLCLVSGHRMEQRGFSGAQRINWRQASDHAAFAKANIPFLFVGVSDHAYYHTENDTIEKVNRSFFTAAAESALNILLLMDQIAR